VKLEDLNFILLNAACKIHNADWNWTGVNSPFARLYMVESGIAKVILPDGEHLIQPGYLYLIPSFTTHSYASDSLFVHYYFHIYNEYGVFDRFFYPFELQAGEEDAFLVKRLLTINPDKELRLSDPKSYDNYSTLQKSIVKQHKLNNRDIETQGILLQLFSRFMAESQPKYEMMDKRIFNVLRYIRTNVGINLYVRELAEMCNLNVDYFNRLFKKEVGCTPIQYVIQKKIERAQVLLVLSNKSVKNIAYELSFDNVQHFNLMFKKVMGMPPNKYRKGNI
jgi:AraC-like DNA-binding protein